MKLFCKHCGLELVKKEGESYRDFKRRDFCNKKCSYLGMRNNGDIVINMEKIGNSVVYEKVIIRKGDWFKVSINKDNIIDYRLEPCLDFLNRVFLVPSPTKVAKVRLIK